MGVRRMRNPARAVDVKDEVQPAECDPGADAQRQFDQLIVGERSVQPGPENLIDIAVVEGVLLGELGGQQLSLGKPVPGVVTNVGVVLLVDVVGFGARSTTSVALRKLRQTVQLLIWAVRTRAASNSRIGSVLLA